MWNGVHIFTDHRNLAYIFDPQACVTSVSKALAQRLEGWKGVLGQYRYTICHIPGDLNAWGDLLSRWVSVPALPVRAVAVFSPCDQDDLSNFVLMEPMEVCTTEATAVSLLTWCKTLGVPRVWVSDVRCFQIWMP